MAETPGEPGRLKPHPGEGSELPALPTEFPLTLPPGYVIGYKWSRRVHLLVDGDKNDLANGKRDIFFRSPVMGTVVSSRVSISFWALSPVSTRKATEVGG